MVFGGAVVVLKYRLIGVAQYRENRQNENVKNREIRASFCPFQKYAVERSNPWKPPYFQVFKKFLGARASRPHLGLRTSRPQNIPFVETVVAK